MASTSPVVPNRPIPDMIPRAAVGPSDPTRDDEPRISRRSDGVGRPERRHRHPPSSSAAPPPNRTGSDRLSDPVATPPVGDTTVLDNEDAIASTRTPAVGSGVGRGCLQSCHRGRAGRPVYLPKISPPRRAVS